MQEYARVHYMYDNEARLQYPPFGWVIYNSWMLRVVGACAFRGSVILSVVECEVCGCCGCHGIGRVFIYMLVMVINGYVRKLMSI